MGLVRGGGEGEERAGMKSRNLQNIPVLSNGAAYSWFSIVDSKCASGSFLLFKIEAIRKECARTNDSAQATRVYVEPKLF